MKVDRRGDDWVVTDAAGKIAGRFGSSEAAWRFADRATGDPISKAEQRADHHFRQDAARSNVARKSAKVPRDHGAWDWPEGLHPLRDWMASKHVDVAAVKTARQALWMGRKLAKVRAKMPKHRHELFPALLALQRQMVTDHRPRPARPAVVSREHGLGTFGPASEVRRIDPSTYRLGDRT